MPAPQAPGNLRTCVKAGAEGAKRSQNIGQCRRRRRGATCASMNAHVPAPKAPGSQYQIRRGMKNTRSMCAGAAGAGQSWNLCQGRRRRRRAISEHRSVSAPKAPSNLYEYDFQDRVRALRELGISLISETEKRGNFRAIEIGSAPIRGADRSSLHSAGADHLSHSDLNHRTPEHIHTHSHTHQYVLPQPTLHQGQDPTPT